MEITKTNFEKELPAIEAAIKEATFLAIDCEFTGLSTSGSNITAYDTPAEYYTKTHGTSKDFLVVQFGLAIFRYDSEKKLFQEKSYNFYVFPRKSSKLQPGESFVCTSSSMEFLINNGFDFNKLFKEGIPYLNRNGQAKLKLALETAQANMKRHMSTLTIPVNLKQEVDNILEEINEFLDSDDAECVLSSCNAYVRRLVYQSVDSTLSDRVSLSTRLLENNERVLVATRPQTLREKEEADAKVLSEATGFAKIIEIISESGKLIVGHNMFLDICQIINRFLLPLPEEYESFKKLAHHLFPRIIDTKHLASIDTFKELIQSTVLSKLLERFSKPPFKLPKIENENIGISTPYSIDSPREHEAGYDAYITGLCLITMWQHLGTQPTETHGDVFDNFDYLHPHLNKLYLMRIVDVPHITLDGPDLQPSRDHVFHLTFPKEWSGDDITQLFRPFGDCRVHWINDTSAFVALDRIEQVSAVLSRLSSRKSFTIVPYSKLRSIQSSSAEIIDVNGENSSLPPSNPQKQEEKQEDSDFVLVRSKRKRKTPSCDEPSASANVVPQPKAPKVKTTQKTFAEASWDD